MFRWKSQPEVIDGLTQSVALLPHLTDLSPQGVGSQFLEKLPFGQEVNVLSPLGVFTVDDSPEEESLSFVATGAGIAPFRGMILDQLQNKHDTRDITLYWGLREADHLFWEDEFAQLADAFPNFHFHPTLSRPPVEWPLCRGRVTNCLTVHALLPKAGYYICGNRMMVEEVSALLQTKGVLPAHIHHENF